MPPPETWLWAWLALLEVCIGKALSSAVVALAKADVG